MMNYVLALAMPQLVLWFLLTPAALVLSQPVPTVSDMAPSLMLTPPPDCPTMCGNVHIPFPFGIGGDCAWPGLDNFTLTCDYSLNPPRPYLGNIEIINISLEAGEMRVVTPVSHICYNSSNTIESNETYWQLNFTSWRSYLISPKRNEFTAIGCNTKALLGGRDDWSFLTGCITTCVSLDGAAHDGDPCAGLGCCHAPITSNLSTIAVSLSDILNTTFFDNSPCSYAFVAEKDWYNFSREDLNGIGEMAYDRRVEERSLPPLVLDWAITSNGTCPPPLAANPVAPACVDAHSYCINATGRHGYLCNCSDGYMGNPYVRSGCTNINECELRKSDPERYEKQYPCQRGSTCHDTKGGYECKCNFWLRGDGKTDKGCQPIFPTLAVAIAATVCAVILLGLLLWFIRREHKRRQLRGFFDRNGGQILKSMNINIFTKEQLDKITQNYKTNIGNGSFGMVYMGTTDENQQVAVKRSIVEGEMRRQDEFVNELTIQFRISHTNLVRLIGCCLETEVPMLVFEFIANGSLYHVLHGAENRTLSFLVRLDIAIGSAEALAYMHSHGGYNIVHGDVKSSNILLDDNFMPKVSDFGSSKLVLVARYANWSVMGDMNYIDPVYIKTGHFTEKSDVYSFGVVLLELITRKKAKYEGSNSLPINFVKCYNDEGIRREMYDKEILSTAQPHYMECLDRIGGIAVQCLKEEVDERPTMTQVVEELKLVQLRAHETEIVGENT